MKNRFFNPLWVFVCGMMLSVASCEKMVISQDVSGSSLSAVTRTNTGDYNRLNFVVFDENGERVDQKNQELGDDDFGEANFTLPVGTYRLALVAHSAKGNPSVNKRTYDANGDVKKNESISFANDKGFTDTFFDSQLVEVGEEAVTVPFDLKRIVSMIRFQPTDVIPEHTDSIRIYYEGGSGSIDVVTTYGNVHSKQTMWFAKEEPLEIYTIPWQDNDYLKVTIGAYHGTDLLTTTEIENIPIRRNAITTCRGNLFDGKVTNVSFSFTIETTWGEPIDYVIPGK